MRYTISPILSRLLWPLLMRKIFGPQPVPAKFTGFPKAMAVRPSQIRASAAESALMIPDAAAYRDIYSGLRMPVAIVAGARTALSTRRLSPPGFIARFRKAASTACLARAT